MKIMLDECMGLRTSRSLKHFFDLYKPPDPDPPIHTEFLLDFLKQKTALDVDWSKILADEGGWVVISCDYKSPKGAKAKLKGPPLHLILPYRKITGFFFAEKIAQCTGFEKARAVVCVSNQLLASASAATPGTRFKVTPSGSGYHMEEWPIVESLSSIFSPTGKWAHSPDKI